MSELRLSTLKNTIKFYDGAFDSEYFRDVLLNKRTNGFDKCIVNVGKRAFINLDMMEEWLLVSHDLIKDNIQKN